MGKNFNFGATPVAKIADEIRNNDSVSVQQPTNDIQPEFNEVSTVFNETSMNGGIIQPGVNETSTDNKPTTVKKTDVGVTIQLPKKYYRTLRDIKDETGIPLRDLALRAVIEYIDNYQFEN